MRDFGTNVVLQRVSISVMLTEDKARNNRGWLLFVGALPSPSLPLLEQLDDEVHLLFDPIDPFVQSIHPLVQSTYNRGLGRLERPISAVTLISKRVGYIPSWSLGTP